MLTQIPRPTRQQLERQIEDKTLTWIQSATDLLLECAQNHADRKEIDSENILRWEDDGGFIIEVNISNPGS